MPNLNLHTGSYSVASWITGDGANPTPGETVTIGADVYEWDGVGVNINVAVGINLAASIDALIVAIDANTAEVIEVWRETNTLMLMPYDDDNEDYLVCGAFPVLAASQAADFWADYVGSCGGGQNAAGKITMTADLVARVFDIKVPFTVSGGFFQWFDAAGLILSTITATVVPSATGDGVTIDPTAGGVNPVATNMLHWYLFE